MTEVQQRILFVHQLRGFAALSVVISHYFGVFWSRHEGIAGLMGIPPLRPELLPGFLVGHTNAPSLVGGMFGVGIFFIISGYVISFSVTKESRSSFLVRRFFRIYPVYLAGFSLTAMALVLIQFHTDSPFNQTLFDVLAHFTIVLRGPLDVVRLDGISWTLEVEVYFYLFMMLFGTLVTGHGLKGLYSVSVAVFLLAFYIGGFVGVQVSAGLMLLVGVAYYLRHTSEITRNQFNIFLVWVAILQTGLWMSGSLLVHQRMFWLAAFLLALAVFEICFQNADKFGHSPVMDHLADISYPLYVCRALVGYSVIYFLLKLTGSTLLSIGCAIAVAYLLALSLHLLVEKPSVRFSKKITIPEAKTGSDKRHY